MALVSVKMIEMTFQNHGRLYTLDTVHEFQCETTVFDSERIRVKMQVVKHLQSDNCFKTKMLND